MRVGGEAALRRMLDVPRHPQVNKEVPPALEPENQILAPPRDGGDALALERGGDGIWWLGPGEPWVADLDTLERPPFQARREARPDRLDLGEFWHALGLPSGDDV